ncbi:hypothetical protein Tco_0377756 [Tanacetum coccineum]
MMKMLKMILPNRGGNYLMQSSKKGNSQLVQPMQQSIAYEVPVISTAEENISTAGRTVTYRIRSEEERTRKDKENNNDRALSPEESKN